MQPWDVEENSLEEESEADPLVVLVVFLLLLPLLLPLIISPSDAGGLNTRVGLGLLQLGICTDQAAVPTSHLDFDNNL